MTISTDIAREFVNLIVRVGDNTLTSNLVDINETFDSEEVELANILHRTLAAGASDVEIISSTSITEIKTIIIIAESEVQYKLNSTGNTAYKVTPKNNSYPGFMILSTSATALYLTNPSSTDSVNVRVFIIGE